ncbi:UNVERIFIED_CONTAM: hypothetical protein H355_006529 [Colinus virginianus]|nr:hypothetical protein H355_006529 [Colinus virginianus]
MRLLAALMVTTAWSYGFAQETPIQSPVSVTKSQGNTDLKCHFKDFSGYFDNTVIHWYQQKENEAPVRMIYFSSGTVQVDGSFQRQRYRIQTTSRQKLCTLTIRNVIPEDSATYYCAYWDPHYGTRQQSPQQIFPCQLNHNSLERYHVNSRGVDELLSQKQFHVNLSEDGFAQEIPIQSPVSITRFQKSARMFCEMKKLPGSFENTVIHWYQMKENKAPQRLLFFAGGKATVESGFEGKKYMVDKVPRRNLCILTINDVNPDDAATYYCAYWDPHHDRCSENIKPQSSFNHSFNLSHSRTTGDTFLWFHAHDHQRPPKRVNSSSHATQHILYWGQFPFMSLNRSQEQEENMLLLAALLATTNGFTWEIPIQSPVSITKSQGSIRLLCNFEDFSGNFDKTAIHWYQQKENNTLMRMAYSTSGATVVDDSFQKHRYMIQTVSRQKICILTIRNVLPDDAASYYCAYWVPHYGSSSAITTTNTPPAAQPQVI